MARSTHRNLLCRIQSRMNESPAISKEAEAFLEAMENITDRHQKIEVMVAMLRLLNKEDL